jgi:hypothetical protein
MAKARKPLPTDLIDEYLKLEEGGVLVWKKSPHPRIAVGAKAGRSGGKRHSQVCLKRKHYGYHRIVYYLAYGIDSLGWEIDHINRDPSDNRPENLRLASEAENKWNAGCQANCKSSLRGIRSRFWGASTKWEARYRGRYIGSFDSREEAVAAWEAVVKPYAGEFFLPQKLPL